MIDAFQIERANSVDLLAVARSLGASSLKRVGGEWCGPCLRCGGRDRFSIHVGRQVWNCRGCGVGGDTVDLVRHVLGLDFRQAVEHLTGQRAEQRRGPWRSASSAEAGLRAKAPGSPPLTLAQIANALDGEVHGDRVLAPLPGRARQDRSMSVILNPAAPGGFAVFSNETADFRALREFVRNKLAGDLRSEAFVRDLVAGVVRELGPVRRSPGEVFFREERKIDTDAIADVLERTDAIGWHPSILFREQGHALDGRLLGCLIGVMTDAVTAKPTGAISRTYLHEGRKVGKAKTLGRPTGIVRLSRDEDVLEGLYLAEGLETAIDAMARGFRPIWSTGSAGLMAASPVLGGVECLTVFADNDDSGKGLEAAQEAAARWRDAGREAHVWLRGIRGDLNDAFREIAG